MHPRDKLKLKRLDFIRELPYTEMVEAHKIIERGADASLLYLWFNLLKANYYPNVLVHQVQAECERHIEQAPEFKRDIENWFINYVNTIAKKESQIRNSQYRIEPITKIPRNR